MVSVSLLSIIIAALAPGISWLIFFLKEDLHPEPRRLIALTFGVGMVASLPVVILQILGQELFAVWGVGTTTVLIALAAVEEIFKFGAAYLAIGHRKEVDEPVDVMIYMIVAALGLATIENFFILMNFIGETTTLYGLVNVSALRFVGATFLHALASGVMGFYWARGILVRLPGRFIILGLVVATVLHTIFNYLILTFQNAGYLVIPSVFLVLASILLFRDFEELKRVDS